MTVSPTARQSVYGKAGGVRTRGAAGESWLTAAIPIENPYCSCKLTRVRPRQTDQLLDDEMHNRHEEIQQVNCTLRPRPRQRDEATLSSPPACHLFGCANCELAAGQHGAEGPRPAFRDEGREIRRTAQGQD